MLSTDSVACDCVRIFHALDVVFCSSCYMLTIVSELPALLLCSAVDTVLLYRAVYAVRSIPYCRYPAINAELHTAYSTSRPDVA